MNSLCLFIEMYPFGLAMFWKKCCQTADGKTKQINDMQYYRMIGGHIRQTNFV